MILDFGKSLKYTRGKISKIRETTSSSVHSEYVYLTLSFLPLVGPKTSIRFVSYRSSGILSLCGFLLVFGKPYNVLKSCTFIARGGGCFFKDVNLSSSLSKEFLFGFVSSFARGEVGNEGAR